MSSNKTSDTLLADNTALAFTAMQIASEAYADFTSQSLAFWSAALDSAQAGSTPTISPAAPPQKVQSPPFLSIVPVAPSPRSSTRTGKPHMRQTKTSTARSWYRKPVDSPIETMINFWGSFMPTAQFSNPWLPGVSSPQLAANALGTAGTMAAVGAMAEITALTAWPNLLQNSFPAPTIPAPIQANPMTPWSFWQSTMPWQPSANSSATPAIADLYGLASASIWLSQPSHNGWTKSPSQEITDAWSWVTKSWSADPFGTAAVGPVSTKQARR